jgi:hypothetical protein
VTTIRDLAAEFKVPMGDVVKALMNLGVTRTATQELHPDEIEHVKKLLRTAPPRPRDEGGSSGEGVREPKRPHPPTLSGEAAATEKT